MAREAAGLASGAGRRSRNSWVSTIERSVLWSDTNGAMRIKPPAKAGPLRCPGRQVDLAGSRRSISRAAIGAERAQAPRVSPQFARRNRQVAFADDVRGAA